VWAWLANDVLDALEARTLTDRHFVALIDALQVTEPIALGPDAVVIVGTNAVHDAAGDSSSRATNDEGEGGFVVVHQPHGADVWSALLGGPTATQLRGIARRARSAEAVVVTVEAGPASPATDPSAPPRPERCSGERRELVRIDAPDVAGAFDTETARRLCVVLPQGYGEDRRRRHPVVYLLPGYGGNDTAYLHLADAAGDAILVGIDGRTAFGATYFRDTRAAGAWERFFERAIAEVDRRYRTRAEPAARALLGHSTGGYNAIAIALSRPDLVRAAAASSPDALDLDAWMLDRGVVRETWRRWAALEDALGGPGQMVSYAVQLADDSTRGAIAWPFDLRTGVLDAERWERWRDDEPMRVLHDPEGIARVRAHLDDRLFVSVGRHDAFELFAPAERFHARLDELGVRHAWRPTDDDHFVGSDRRRAEGLAFLLERLR
jgi:S-formylglutathione hydrolase FrmB